MQSIFFGYLIAKGANSMNALPGSKLDAEHGQGLSYSSGP